MDCVRNHGQDISLLGHGYLCWDQHEPFEVLEMCWDYWIDRRCVLADALRRIE